MWKSLTVPSSRVTLAMAIFPLLTGLFVGEFVPVPFSAVTSGGPPADFCSSGIFQPCAKKTAPVNYLSISVPFSEAREALDQSVSKDGAPSEPSRKDRVPVECIPV